MIVVGICTRTHATHTHATHTLCSCTCAYTHALSLFPYVFLNYGQLKPRRLHVLHASARARTISLSLFLSLSFSLLSLLSLLSHSFRNIKHTRTHTHTHTHTHTVPHTRLVCSTCRGIPSRRWPYGRRPLCCPCADAMN